MSVPRHPYELPQVNIGDPLYRLLADRLRLRLGHVMAFLLVNNLLQTIVYPILHHRRLGSSLLTSASLQDIQIWLVSFISQPIMFFVYWRSVDIVPRVFKTLHDNRVIRARGPKTAAQFLLELQERMTRRSYNLLLLALVLFALLMFNLLGWSAHRFQPPVGSYPYTDFQQYALYTPYGLLRFWFVAWAVTRGLIFIDVLKDWWDNFEVDVKPLHPDGAGGLSVVGDTTLYSGLMVGASGLFVGSTIVVNLQTHQGALQLGVLLILSAVILLIAPLAFFFPIWSTHRAMLAARERQLERLAERFNTQWDALFREHEEVTGEEAGQLSDLMQLREITLKTVPIWPFGKGDFGRYGLSITPLWTVAVYVLLQVVFPGLLSSLLGLGPG